MNLGAKNEGFVAGCLGCKLAIGSQLVCDMIPFLGNWNSSFQTVERAIGKPTNDCTAD